MHRNIRAPRRMPTRLAALGAATLAAIGFGLGAASPALAHDELVGQSIVLDASDGSVAGIKLSFSNNIMEIGTEIHITDAAGEEFGDGEPVVEGRDVTQALKSGLLVDGEQYEVVWRVVSSDGHPIQGAFSLHVAGEDSAISIEDPRFEEGSSDPEGEHATADDHSTHEHHDAVTTQESQNSGVPVGAWVAIAVALAVAAGAFGAGVRQQQRKRQAAAGASNSSSGTDASAESGAPNAEGEL